MSPKKMNAGRRSSSIPVEDSSSTEPALTQRSAEAHLRTLIAKFAASHLRLINGVRRWLRKRLPTAHEIVYEYRDCFVISYSPNDRGYEGVFAIRANEEGVKFYFNRGKGLPDPEKLLHGSGNQTRWIHLEAASTLARPEVASLIDEALARNLVPFELSGSGSVVIRSAEKKQRPPAGPGRADSGTSKAVKKKLPKKANDSAGALSSSKITSPKKSKPKSKKSS